MKSKTKAKPAKSAKTTKKPAKKVAVAKTTKKPISVEPKAEPAPALVTAYKAFTDDMKCRDFQYEIGKTYTHKGRVALCSSGFHACLVPFDCWSYYEHSKTFARVTTLEPKGHNDPKEDSK